MVSSRGTGPFARVHHIVRSIPAGRVMTYGQISEILDRRISAAAVGWALRQCPDDVPWHRVVASTGRCSVGERQLARLAREGVHPRKNGCIDLDAHRHHPRSEG
ncbi:MAG: MGMT family protein [Planctomycetes bacterium]|nr:MGMT family protein [Planctomycetota bacterium]